MREYTTDIAKWLDTKEFIPLGIEANYPSGSAGLWADKELCNRVGLDPFLAHGTEAEMESLMLVLIARKQRKDNG